MGAYENSRPEAKYQGERALFLLLMTTVRVLDIPNQLAILQKRDSDVGDGESPPPRF
jgi:hypothetical protein